MNRLASLSAYSTIIAYLINNGMPDKIKDIVRVTNVHKSKIWTQNEIDTHNNKKTQLKEKLGVEGYKKHIRTVYKERKYRHNDEVEYTRGSA